MGACAKTKKIIKTLTFSLIFVFSTILFSQQTLAACCVVPGLDCYQDPTPELCDDLSGTSYVQSCTEIPICTTEGVCCLQADASVVTQIQCNQGVFFPGQKDPSVCSTEAIQVQGQTNFSNGIGAQTNIEMWVQEPQGSKFLRSVQSNLTGFYNVTLIKGSDYSFKATAVQNTSCSITQTVYLSEDSSNPTIVNLQLPCTNTSGPPLPEPTCVQQWTWTWEFPDKQCGQRLNIQQTNPECTSGVPPKPADYLPCLQDPVLTCIINGVLNPGEQCDPLLGIQGGLNCMDFSNPATGNHFIGGGLACTDGCKISTDGCYSCPLHVSDCTTSDMCDCAVCKDPANPAPICAPQCKPTDKIENAIAKPIPNDTHKLIEVSWDTPEYCSNSNIIIRRCRGTADNKCVTTDPQYVNIPLPGSAISYIDQFSNNANGKYCYNITANVVTNLGATFTISAPQLVCANLSDTICVGKPWDGSEFCNGQELGSCNEQGQYTGQTCMGGCYGPGEDPVNPVYECRPLSLLCPLCDGPFGLFANEDYLLFSTALNNDIYCSQLFSDNVCYQDDFSKNRTIIGDTKACTEIKSCYDYLTQTSCSDNPCDIVAAENCKWVNFTSVNELGLGVCIPQNVDEQDCTKCEQNGVLGNYCPKEICSLFGDEGKCHYNQNTSRYVTDNYTCMNVEQVSCETYDTEVQCIGSGSSKTNFTANIIYDEQGRIGFNHNVIKNSNDTYGLGRCVWTGNSCIKDSDLSTKKPNAGSTDTRSDCGTATQASINCLLDFTAPNTTIYILNQPFENNSLYSKTQLNYLTATADLDTKETNFAISKGFEDAPGSGWFEYNFVYPKKNRAQIIDEINNPSTTQGKYALYYYSEDENKNLEEVKTIYFELAKELALTLTYTNVSKYDVESDQYLTNLTLRVNNPDETDILCTLNLTLTNNLTKKFSGDGTKTYPNLEWAYTNLVDGNYQAKARCIDQNFQIKELTKDIIIDADTTIKNPQPRGTTYRAGNVHISIETTENAKCYYTNSPTYVPPPNPNTPPVAGIWTQFTNTNAKIHTTTLNVQNEGMHFYYTGCTFGSSPPFNHFVGNYGDMAYFAVDNSAPNLTLIDMSSGQEYNSTTPEYSVNLKLSCTDYHPLLDGIYPTNYSFGCTKVNYSLVRMYPNNTIYAASSFTVVDSGTTRQFVAPDINVNTYLNITLKDLGNNTKTNLLVLLNLRNVSFAPPNVTICDPTNSSLCT